MRGLDEKFYRKTLRKDRQRSYKMMCSYIVKNITPDLSSLVDFGCGVGWFLYYFKKLGIDDIVGVEPNRETLQIVDKSVKENIKFLDLTKKINLKRRFDLALNIEVVEHINKKYEDIVLKNITRHVDLLIFSAATPGQGGHGHVNEQPFKYWERKLNSFGFFCREDETQKFRQYLKKKKAKKWYVKNISIWKRGELKK